MSIYRILLLSFFCLPSLWAQSTYNNTNVRLANLEQDLQRTNAIVGRLQIQIEELQRENAQLRAGNNVAYVTVNEMNSALQSLRQEVASANAQLKNEVAIEVGQQLASLAEKTQKAMQALAKTVEAQPQIVSEIRFSDDFPKSGISYTIQPGDTLSSIAKRNNSTVKDIQNANKILDPAKIQVGSVIFVPQSQ
ncbi:MAG: LysM peptidoglycan-binding domain-containing protein [Opitutales bacterium]|nr:LysM peptidoglycan-binding domain-containing protein [Opitutales bacterium]